MNVVLVELCCGGEGFIGKVLRKELMVKVWLMLGKVWLVVVWVVMVLNECLDMFMCLVLMWFVSLFFVVSV